MPFEALRMGRLSIPLPYPGGCNEPWRLDERDGRPDYSDRVR